MAKVLAKVLANFWATPTIERDVDKNHGSPIAPSTGATPTDSMNKTRNQGLFLSKKGTFLQKSSLFLDGQVGSCLGKILFNTFFCAHNVPGWLRHRKPLDKNTTERQLLTKWAVSTPTSKHRVWSFDTTTIWLKMVTCFAYVTISEAARASQRLHTISCGHAMCLLLFPLISHLRIQSLVLATIYGIALPLVLLLLLPAMQVWPFSCHLCCQGLLLAAQILPLNLPPVLLSPPHICPRFCHRCCHYLCLYPRRFFFPSMLPCKLPPPLPLPVLLPSRLPWLLPSNLGA